jgi:hypothetical protein
MMHGECTWMFSDGKIFKGKVQDGKKTGKGIITKNNVTIFDGNFSNDLYDGEGNFFNN